MNTKPFVRILSYATVVMLVLLPFHAVFTTWIGSNYGHLDLIRIWKELLLVPITLGALWLALKDKKSRLWLKSSSTVTLVGAYVLVTILIGLRALLNRQVNSTALIYALLANLRFPIIFVVGLLLGRRTEWFVKNWQKWLLWPALIVVSFGLLQHFVLPINFLSHFGYGPKTIPPYATVDQKLAYVRIQSTQRGANPLGAYLLLIITLLTGIVFEAKSKTRKAAGLFLLATFICLFFTYSRSAWLGVALSLILLAYWSINNSVIRKRLLIGTTIFIVILVAGLGIFRHSDSFQNTLFHTDETSKSAESSNQQRGQALKDGAKSIVHEPFGRGPGTAGPASVRNNHPPRISENYFLQIGQEVGVIGLLLFLAINIEVGLLLYQNKQSMLMRVLLASLIGLTLVNMLSHAWADDTLGLLWWATAGLALSPVILKLSHGNVQKKS